MIVAEIGVNHEGDVEAASKMLKLAAGAGADAVKFQSYTPDRYASASDPERLERVTRFSLDEDAHRRLAKEAAESNVAFFSTPVTEDMVPLLDELCEAVKIASGDLTFEPVIRASAKTDKPVIISTGLGTEEEVVQAVAWFADEVGQDRLVERLVLMQCVSAYPTPLEESNVRSVPFLAERFGVTVGYSHHSLGIEPCLAAVALGAAVIELHFTDRKSGRDFHDHALSFEPEDLAQLVAMAPKIRASLGHAGKSRQKSELPFLDVVRKGVAAARDLEPGCVLEEDDLMYARPATEFAAKELRDLINRRLNVGLRRGELIPRSGVEEI